MSLNIVEMPESVDDVMRVADYIAARSSLNASDKFLQAVKSSYRQSAGMPSIGVERDCGQPNFQDIDAIFRRLGG